MTNFDSVERIILRSHMYSILAGVCQAVGLCLYAFVIDNFLILGLDYWDLVMYVLSIFFGGFLLFAYPIHLFGLQRKFDAVVVFSSTIISILLGFFILATFPVGLIPSWLQSQL